MTIDYTPPADADEPADLPDADTVQAAGLGPYGTGDGPHTWRDVALAAITMPVTVHIATAETDRYTWQGIGATDDQARDALLTAWYAHADAVGADPDYLTRDQITVQAAHFGQGFCDWSPTPLLP